MIRLFVASLVALSSCAPILAQNTAFERVETLVDDYANSNQFQGNIRVSIEGEGVLDLSRGFANIEQGRRHDLGSQFYVASITKAFSAVMSLQMVEEGLLELDAPIARYFPEMRPEFGSQISLRQLLNHTSGLSRVYSEALSQSGPYSIDQVVEAVNAVELLGEPGRYLSYSNTGYRLIAHILETVSGQSYEALLRHRISDRVGLTSTSLHPRSDVVEGYVSTDTMTLTAVDSADPEDRSNLGAAGLYSSVEDLNRFVDGFLDGRLLSAEMRDLILTATEAENSGGSEGMGFQFWPISAGGRVIGMSGVSDGYQSAVMWIDGSPDSRITMLNNDSRLGRSGYFPLLVGLLGQVLGNEEVGAAVLTPLHTFLDTLLVDGEGAALAYATTLDWSQAPVANAAASQATGAPNGGVGETMYAWAPATADAGVEWLSLSWNRPVRARAIHVQFTQIPDVVTSVEIGGHNNHPNTLSPRRITAQNGAPVQVYTLAETGMHNAVTLHMNTADVAGWPQIDAVALVDESGAMHWADSADASTSAFRSGGVAMHDLPTSDVLLKLAARLDENNRPLIAERVRALAPQIGK
jgi:CubicO group peptidase (beta-lactamase class C family)